jgi:hypothetical protein
MIVAMKAAAVLLAIALITVKAAPQPSAPARHQQLRQTPMNPSALILTGIFEF